MTPLAPHMEAFLREHLVRHRGVSQHTCDSYAYSFQSLFEFASQKLKVAPSALMLEQLDASLISSSWNIWRRYVATPRRHEISAWLPSGRSSGFCSTASQPLSNRFAAFWQSPSRKPTTRLVPYLAQEEMQALLDAPDPSTRMGVRDRAMLHLGGVRGTPSLRTDRFAHRRCRTPVGEYPRARQGPPRTRAASLEDDGCGTPRLVGHSRSGRIP